jgi:ABC-type transporter Mla subunit MlaD
VTATELSAVLLGVVALAAVAVLAVVTARLWRLCGELSRLVDEIRTTTPAAVADLTDAAQRASRQVDRLEDLIHVTGEIADRVDTATGVTFRALSNPVIKGAAITRGTTRAARRLRRGGSS